MYKMSTVKRPVIVRQRTRSGLIALTALALVWFMTCPVAAQDSIDHGPTGTLNHDYFAAMADPGSQLHWNVGDSEKNHLGPAIRTIQSGQYAKAWQDLDFMLRRFVNHPKALEAMAAVASMTNQPPAAIPYFENAIRLYPQYALTYAQYGRYLGRIGRHDAAISNLKKATEVDPNLAVAYAWLAGVYTDIGQGPLAKEAAEQAKKLGYNGRM